MASTTKISPITLFLVLIFVTAATITTIPKSNAQQLSMPIGLILNNININTIIINGTLTCSPTLTLPATLLTPPLVNATVQITLNNAIIAAVNTTATGAFTISLNVTNVLNGPITNANLNTLRVNIDGSVAGCRILTTLQPGVVFQLLTTLQSVTNNGVANLNMGNLLG
ncbi:unnamed protein product [Amaranthus hypochondriacus]